MSKAASVRGANPGRDAVRGVGAASVTQALEQAPESFFSFFLCKGYVLWIPAVDKDGAGEMVPIQQEYMFSPCFLVLVTKRALAQTKEEALCGLTV